MIQSSEPQPQDANRVGSTRHGWVAHVVLACVGGFALVGMLLGFYDSVEPSRQPDYTTSHDAGKAISQTVPQAVAYSDMKGAGLGVNASWETVWPIAQDDPIRLYGSDPASEQDRAAAVARRAQRRAFDGAPPVVPHAIDQQNASSCLVCHGDGLKIGTVVAPRMSHEAYANCTQCHVESINRALPPTTGPRAAATLFQGLASPGPGERAWPGAPPIIPHTTRMREDCTSCHGTLADRGLMTSHPWRGNCLQCHGLSADLDQRQTLDADRPPVMIGQDVKE